MPDQRAHREPVLLANLADMQCPDEASHLSHGWWALDGHPYFCQGFVGRAGTPEQPDEPSGTEDFIVAEHFTSPVVMAKLFTRADVHAEYERGKAEGRLQAAAEVWDARKAYERGRREATEGLPSAEALARQFHEAYEALAPQHGYETRKASAKPWEDVPANNRALMIATCAVIRSRLVGPWEPAEQPDLPNSGPIEEDGQPATLNPELTVPAEPAVTWLDPHAPIDRTVLDRLEVVSHSGVDDREGWSEVTMRKRPARCPATYERDGGRQPGGRLVECHLQAGHPGEHEEDGTDVTWLPEPAYRCPPGGDLCPGHSSKWLRCSPANRATGAPIVRWELADDGVTQRVVIEDVQTTPRIHVQHDPGAAQEPAEHAEEA